MIIPIEKLVSIPGSHSRDYNNQWCYYETSDDNSTYVINENTKFPSMLDIYKSVATQSEPPETKITYSVFYQDVNSDDIILLIPDKAFKVYINPEPYYNDKTKQYDIFESFVYFTEFEDAYNYSINNPRPITEG